MTTIVCKLCGDPITATRREVLEGKATQSWVGRDRVHTACGDKWHAEHWSGRAAVIVTRRVAG